MNKKQKVFILIFSVLLLAICIISCSLGAVQIPVAKIISFLTSTVEDTSVESNVFWAIRLPRVVLGILVGASLSISGAALQGIFRNPLADPGLIGTSAGGSLAAVAAIVFLGKFLPDMGQYSVQGLYFINFATILGSCIASLIVFYFSRVNGKVNVATMLLVGIAIIALGGSLTGLIIFSSSDAQLRSITFWMMGSLAGANWKMIIGILPFTLVPVIILPGLYKSLDAFALGEGEAQSIGVNVQRLKNLVIILATLGVGASVACTGMIGFLGLIIPHIVRTLAGSNHKYLLPASALGGAILLVGSDLLARTMLAPAELPINIITAIIGTPVFISILVNEKRKFTL